MLRRLAVLSLALAAPVLASAQSADIRGPTSRVTLIELFTSEGCSSCPPAEKWVNGLEDHSDLWSRVVPVAFHVDYWDYIGWPDRFATRDHSLRQRAYREVGHTRGIYTPGFVVGGREWRGWFRNPMLDLPSGAGVRPDLGGGARRPLRGELRARRRGPRTAGAARRATRVRPLHRGPGRREPRPPARARLRGARMEPAPDERRRHRVRKPRERCPRPRTRPPARLWRSG